MSRIAFSLLLLVAVLGLVGCSAGADSNAALADLMNADRARAKALMSPKLAGLGDHYSDQAVVYFPNSPAAIGKAAVVELLAGQRSMAGFRMAEQPTDGSVSTSGDMGYTSGGFVLSQRRENSKGKTKRIEHSGNYVAVWQKRDDGSWECVAHTANFRPAWAS